MYVLLAGYIILSYRTNTWWYQNPRTLILKIPLSTSLTASWNMPLKMPFSIGPFESCWLTCSGSSGLGSRSLAFSLTSALTWTKKGWLDTLMGSRYQYIFPTWSFVPVSLFLLLPRPISVTSCWGQSASKSLIASDLSWALIYSTWIFFPPELTLPGFLFSSAHQVLPISWLSILAIILILTKFRGLQIVFQLPLERMNCKH